MENLTDEMFHLEKKQNSEDNKNGLRNHFFLSRSIYMNEPLSRNGMRPEALGYSSHQTAAVSL